MKVLAIIVLAIGAVTAGSGPYLPSGWKPSGPAFLLPSEVQKTSDNALKETLQVEAEGSDFLREYGPPKANQDLPYISTEHAFAAIEIETNEVVNEDISSLFRQNSEVATEIVQTVVENVESATEVVQADVANQQPVAVSNDENTLAATEVAQTGDEKIESDAVVATSVLQEKSVEVAIEKNVEAEPVVKTGSETVLEGKSDAEEKTIEVAIEGNVEEPAVVKTGSQTVVEGRSFSDIEADEQTTVVYEDTENVVTETVEDEVTEKVQTSVQENENSNSDIVSTLEEKQENILLPEAERAGKSVEEVVVSVVKSEGVDNIGDTLAQLESEIKSQQVQEVVEVKTVQENSGPSIQDAPEGFLEYGPPGFREYGPPKELLRSGDNVEAVESNETRRRRFSPKFRSVRRTHQ